MDIVFHLHHATISDRLRTRAVQGLRKLAVRCPGAVGGTIRFEHDGSMRLVEVALDVPGRKQLFAKAQGRFWGPATADALKQLEHQVAGVRRTRKEQGRRAADARRAVGA